LRASVTASWAPRAGSEASQYEDAFYPPASGPRHARRLRFAVADGASESMLSGLWADLLVRTWCKARRRSMAQILEAAGAAWEIELAAYLEGRERDARPIQWFEEPGLDRGAFSTLLGLAFNSVTHTHGSWTATALGDTCLFQVRDDALLAAFPLKHPDEFDNAPRLVPSRPGDPGRVLGALDAETGDWRTGDTFFLATDAVAAWFLRSVHAGGSPWRTLAELGDAFAPWVDERRHAAELRNDDVTILRIEVL
jgi:hypothetical protein